VDLTADAANKPSVRLRFTHFEPTWDWWVALDNVLVDGDSPDGGGPLVLPAESFSGGIPAAWKHDPGPGSDGADPWSTEDTCQLSLEATGGTFPDTADGRQLHHLGGAFALIDPICSAALVDEYLITPAFDLSGQARAILSVRSAILFTHTAVAEILLSLDGGATFLPVPVFRYGDGSLTVSGEEPYFDELSIDVPAAVGKANVAFAFPLRRQPAGESCEGMVGHRRRFRDRWRDGRPTAISSRRRGRQRPAAAHGRHPHPWTAFPRPGHDLL
jgi:hypothetical protein